MEMEGYLDSCGHIVIVVLITRQTTKFAGQPSESPILPLEFLPFSYIMYCLKKEDEN